MPLRTDSGTTNNPTPDPRRTTPEVSETVPTGVRLGRYEVIGAVGYGSMGTVFQARDPKLGRQVAVKTIRLTPCSLEDEKEFRARLLREAEAAARMLHPGIVTIFDVGHDENSEPYFVMEFVVGDGLDKLIKSKALSLEQSVDIAIQLAQALDYAHRQGIVHRDIKPSNIIVTAEGRVKITDFGIAKVDISQITLPGVMLGTPAYMAPEQLLGGKVDGRSDLFSLGVVLYLMVTGKKPFQAPQDDSDPEPDTVRHRLLNPDAAPPADVAPEVPERLMEIMRRALAKKPADRYQTGLEMARDLEDFRNGHLSRTRSAPVKRTVAPVAAVTQVATKSPSRKTGSKPGVKPAAQTKNRNLDISLDSLAPFLRLPKHLPKKQLPALAIAAIPLLVAVIGVYKIVRHLQHSSVPDTTVSISIPVPVEVKPPSITPAPIAAETADVPSEQDQVTTLPLKKHVPQTTAKPTAHKESDLRKEVVVPTEPLANPATLHVTVQHPFRAGTLAVWSDGQLVYVSELSISSTERLVGLGHSSANDAANVRLPAGQHLIRVRVTSDGYEASNGIEGTFSNAQPTTLHVIARKGSGLKLTLE